MPRKLSRRRFLQQSSLAMGVASVAISGTNVGAQVLGANDRVNIAVAGINGRGGSHIGAYTSMKDVKITHLIDPDRRIWDNKKKMVKDKAGYEPETVTDFRKVLDNPEVNAISIATCNHWHAPMTIFALQANKDVYVEKPMSHNIHEGRIAVELAHKNKRIVQHGTQGRASGGNAGLAALAASGKLGKLLISRGLCYKGRGSIGFKETKEPPKDLDFNLWLGPAPEQPYHENLVHYNWHWFWDFGNGDIGNQGVHEMDKARWFAGQTLPLKVFSLGGRFGYKDQGQTPNTQIVFFDYGPDKPMIIFEVRGLRTNPYLGEGVGNMMHFEEGTVTAKGAFLPKGSDKSEPAPKVSAKLNGPGDIFNNFIHCVRTRNESEQHAPVLEAHYSAALCHLGNISYRLGEEVPFNKQSKALGDNKDAVETFDRMVDHLKLNNLKLEETNYQLGRVLNFDPKREKFIGDDQANRLLTRDYRAPFTIPDKVV
ncbi:MAG: Gfo/Idh/MocA family oxidoreductase [Phycisphaeraceae bacterium]